MQSAHRKVKTFEIIEVSDLFSDSLVLSVDRIAVHWHTHKPPTCCLGTFPYLRVGNFYFHELRIYRHARLSRA